MIMIMIIIVPRCTLVGTWQGTHGTGKMANKNSLQGKLREFENFAKLREFQSDIFLTLLIIIILNYDI